MPYQSSDYRGLVDEFLRNRRRHHKVAVQENGKIDVDASKSSWSLSKRDIVVSETEVAADRMTPLCHRMRSYFGRGD